MCAVAAEPARAQDNRNLQQLVSARNPLQIGPELAVGAVLAPREAACSLETQKSDVSSVMGQEPSLAVDSFTVEEYLRGLAASRPGSRPGSVLSSTNEAPSPNAVGQAATQPRSESPKQLAGLRSFAFQKSEAADGEIQELFGGEIASNSPVSNVIASQFCEVPSGSMSPGSTPIYADATTHDATANGGPKFVETLPGAPGGGFMIDLVAPGHPRFNAPTAAGGECAAGVFPAPGSVPDHVTQSDNCQYDDSGAVAATATAERSGDNPLGGSPGYVDVPDGFLISFREPEGQAQPAEQPTLEQLMLEQMERAEEVAEGALGQLQTGDSVAPATAPPFSSTPAGTSVPLSLIHISEPTRPY